MRSIIVPALGLSGANLALATGIYAASYAGPVFRLAFTQHEDGSYALEQIGSTLGCGYNPAWFELDQATGTLFCATKLIRSTTPVDFLRPQLGLAHYAGGAVSVYDTSDPSNLVELQSFHYFMDAPGPNATLQDKPYPHEIEADPTGKFIVVLDRGADALRTFAVGWDGRLAELRAHFTEPGNGPRHGVFVRGTGKAFLYVLGELTNSLHGFEVLCADDGPLGFARLYNDSAYQTGFGGASGIVLPSEIALAEGGRRLVLSTRNDGRGTYRGEPSDTIVSYSVDLETGGLTLVGLTASGGLWPRSFAISRDGTLLAVADQYSVPGRLIVFGRDPDTGVVDDQSPLATWTTNITLPDGRSISHILWDEGE